MMQTNESAVRPRVLTDRHGRQLRYVRLSVTDLCNLSCTYCNPVQGCATSHPHRLGWDDLEYLATVCVTELGVEALRITGGEPTIRPGLVNWISSIRGIPGLRDLSMTTNGILLSRMARDLARAGLNRLNISLDSFDPGEYRELTRGGSLQRCLEGIQAALGLFRPVKLNAVLLRDVTPRQLDRFLAFSDENEVEVRFIELMPLADEKEHFRDQFLGVEAVKKILEDRGVHLVPEGDGVAAGNKTGMGPATTYSVAGSRARLGFISQVSNTKCLTCNKLRLTSDGTLKPCLLAPEEIDLTGAIKLRDSQSILRAMRQQFLQRPERYDALIAENQSLGRGMQAIGG